MQSYLGFLSGRQDDSPRSVWSSRWQCCCLFFCFLYSPPPSPPPPDPSPLPVPFLFIQSIALYFACVRWHMCDWNGLIRIPNSVFMIVFEEKEGLWNCKTFFRVAFVVYSNQIKSFSKCSRLFAAFCCCLKNKNSSNHMPLFNDRRRSVIVFMTIRDLMSLNKSS